MTSCININLYNINHNKGTFKVSVAQPMLIQETKQRVNFLCLSDINECDRGNYFCEPRSHCVDIPGSYKCKCNSGYTNSSDENGNLICIR